MTVGKPTLELHALLLEQYWLFLELIIVWSLLEHKDMGA